MWVGEKVEEKDADADDVYYNLVFQVVYTPETIIIWAICVGFCGLNGGGLV